MASAEQNWMGKVARVSCVLCTRMGLGDSPSVVHHVKYGTGASDRASDFLTVAVCREHHVGKEGIHTLKEHGLYLRYKWAEARMVDRGCVD